MAELVAGWGWPVNSRKAHYFERGEIVCLCRKWMYAGRREDDNDGSADNCAECRRKVAKLRAAERKA